MPNTLSRQNEPKQFSSSPLKDQTLNLQSPLSRITLLQTRNIDPIWKPVPDCDPIWRFGAPEPGCSRSKWFFTRQEIESHSPSRRDGISLKKEAQLRRSYSLLLQEIGTKLKVPHLTIATAKMLCHRFYMHQSHAKNDWQTIATACILVACKVDDTPHFLSDVAFVAYEIAHKFNPSALESIRQREFFRKQKELIVVAERALLTTIDFDLDIQLPYKTLVAVLKRLNIPDLAKVAKVAWHLIDQWLQTSLCLQYKPHYIAAGSIALVARILEVKLPTEKGKIWWLEIDVAPEQLDEVIKWMHSKLEPLPSKSTTINHSELCLDIPPWSRRED